MYVALTLNSIYFSAGAVITVALAILLARIVMFTDWSKRLKP